MNNPDLTVYHRLSSERSGHIAEKLMSIAETVIFCGRQGLAFRGHRDGTPSTKEDLHGNFLALLQFRVQAGDLILKHHLDNAGNALYTSKTQMK